MLEQIKSECIVLNAVVNNWKQAIEVAAMPLVNAGYINAKYVDDIIDNVIEFGPYIVIAPHIAIPHARANGNVIKNVIGICTLKIPVKFNNEANDPVKYVFILGAIDNQTHLKSLSELAILLEDQKFFDLLDIASNQLQVIDFLTNRKEG